MKEFLIYLLGAARGGIAKLALGATGKVLDKAPVSQLTTAKGLTAAGILMQGKPAPSYADADEQRIAEGGEETAIATLGYPAFKLTAQDQADLKVPIGGVL